MVRTMKIEDVNPRRDVDYILNKVREFLNSCDPQDRPDIKMTVAARGELLWTLDATKRTRG
jgi:hypothetical protein